VWGIEPDTQSYNQALNAGYKRLMNKTIEDSLIEIENEKFDYLLAGDIFEHLADPKSILIKIKDFTNDGSLVLSLPNVAHYSIRLSLLFGYWNMTETGILDRTHLHFYTLKTAKELLANSGWEIKKIKPRGDLERWFRKIGLENFGKYLLNLWPELFAVQFVFVAKKISKV
jgi:2-polyprenyl-3-methyl-5-hydroxy-6-metoxy-1,4-benzoquinol methylase